VKFVPVTVKVNDVPPAIAAAGLKFVIVGGGVVCAFAAQTKNVICMAAMIKASKFLIFLILCRSSPYKRRIAMKFSHNAAPKSPVFTRIFVRKHGDMDIPSND
jgi:hypothetical protein